MRKVLFILMILVPSICNSDELKSKINEVSCIKSTGNENFIESCVVNIEINPMHAGNNLMCYGELELHGSRHEVNSVFRYGFLASSSISAEGNPNPLRLPFIVDFPEKWKVTNAKELWVKCEFSENNLPYNKSLKDAP